MAIEINQDSTDENRQAGFVRQYNVETAIINRMSDGRRATQNELDRIYTRYGVEDEQGATRLDTEQYTRGKQRRSGEKIAEIAATSLLASYAITDASLPNEYDQVFQSDKWTTDTSVGLITRKAQPKKSAFDALYERPVNPLNDKGELRSRAQRFGKRVTITLDQGINNGLTVNQISKELDIVYGFRNSKGQLLQDWTRDNEFINVGLDRKRQKLTFSIKPRKLPSTGGAIYQTVRIARTEANMVGKEASRQEMLYAQSQGIEERLQKISVLDDRTRPQSAEMDGQISDREGRFKFPGVSQRILPTNAPARYSVNDRGSYVPYIDGLTGEAETRAARNLETGKTEVIQNMNYLEWFKQQYPNARPGTVLKNRYNQVIGRK